MTQSGPVVIAEDDIEDQDIMREAISEIGIANEIVFRKNCEEVLKYLKETHERPFLILSDINMPQMNGLELKMQIDRDPDLSLKNIAFVFYNVI